MSDTKCRLIRSATDDPAGYAEDREALLRTMASKNKQLGYESYLPPFKDCTAIFVFERDGQVIGGFAFKRVEDFIVIGDSPEVLHAGFNYEARIRTVLRMRGATEMIGAVPVRLMFQWKPQRKPAMELIMKRLGMNEASNFVFFEGQL